MRKSHAMKWINALRSGEYKQGKRYLHNTFNNTYCCLGVLDSIFPEMKLSGVGNTSLQNYMDIGLSSPSGLIQGQSLANLNDHDVNFTFDEIADVIQIEYVEGV